MTSFSDPNSITQTVAKFHIKAEFGLNNILFTQISPTKHVNITFIEDFVDESL